MNENEKNDETEMMTNRNLALLCAKGIVEWGRRDDNLVRHTYEYEHGKENEPIDSDIAVRPFSKQLIEEADDSKWYLPTIDCYKQLLGIQGIKSFVGGWL